MVEFTKALLVISFIEIGVITHFTPLKIYNGTPEGVPLEI